MPKRSGRTIASQERGYRRAKYAEKRGGGPIRILDCLQCGEPFARLHQPGRPPTTCSDECRNELTRVRAKDWYDEHPERVALQLSRQQDHVRENNLAYYVANREREIKRALAYASGPGREAKRARDARRFALTRGAPDAEDFTLDEIFDRDVGVCHLCGGAVVREGRGSLSATMDHVIPVTRGGPHTRANVKLAHRGCNTRKGNRLLVV